MSTVHDGCHWPYVALEHLKCGYCNWRTESEIVFNCNKFKSSHMWLVATIFDSTGLESIGWNTDPQLMLEIEWSAYLGLRVSGDTGLISAETGRGRGRLWLLFTLARGLLACSHELQLLCSWNSRMYSAAFWAGNVMIHILGRKLPFLALGS